MPQPYLSSEIITLIINHLAYEKQTLYSLLTVNKLCFKLTVSVLYRNPFRPCFWCDGSGFKKGEVIYLLLASSNLLLEPVKSPRKEHSHYLKWEPSTAPFTVNYLNYYTELNYSDWESIACHPYFSMHTRSYSNLELGLIHFLNLMFLKHQTEKIESIYLPILDMKPYLPLAARLSSLRRIEFCRNYDDIATYSNDQNIVTIKDAIEFVKIHVETFGDTLTEIKIPDFSSLDYNGIPSDIQIWDLIKTLKQPQVIELGDSYNVCQYLQVPYTDHLRVFDGPFSCENGELRDWDWDSASLFQHCPKLENVRFKPSQSNSFKWAVERRDLYINSGTISDSKLPPLQYVNISCQHCAALPIVQDIIYAFRNTIKSVSARDFGFSGPSPEPLCWDWLLPNLVRIELGADLSLFDLESLNLCPSLEEIDLSSCGEDCNSRHEYGSVLRLPNLRSIKLFDRISLQFNLDSLKYSPLLGSILLSENDSSLSLPASDSPCWTWTWDWKLPHLYNLILRGKLAFHFQFRLLDSCPPLRLLELDTRRYCRELSLEEILPTDTYLLSDSVNQVLSECVFSDNRRFILRGKWKLSEKTLSSLLLRYMPHIKTIRFTDIEGLTATDVIRVTQKLSHAQSVSCNLFLDYTDIIRLGTKLTSWTNHNCRISIGSVEYCMGYIPNEKMNVSKEQDFFIRLMAQR